MNRGEENLAKHKQTRFRHFKVINMKKAIFSVMAVIFGLSSAMAFAQAAPATSEPVPVVKKAESNKHHSTQTHQSHQKTHKKVEKKEVKPVTSSAS